MSNKVNIVDMFCGGGDESTGLISAAHNYGFDVNMSAINHKALFGQILSEMTA